MEKNATGREGTSKGGRFKALVLGLAPALVSTVAKGAGRTDAEAEADEERKFRRMVLHGWIIVCAIAALFVAYGLLAFFIIGDKGPPDWDYGSMKDVPAQSVDSTYPYREHGGQPEPQHVDRRPADAFGR